MSADPVPVPSSTDTAGYRSLNANHPPNFRHLVTFYDQKAVDRSTIRYTFRATQVNIEVHVHKKLPLGEFKTFLLDFFRVKMGQDYLATPGGEIEIRVVKRGAPLLGTEQSAIESEVEDDQVEDEELADVEVES